MTFGRLAENSVLLRDTRLTYCCERLTERKNNNKLKTLSKN
jgi:hypothetical protein